MQPISGQKRKKPFSIDNLDFPKKKASENVFRRKTVFSKESKNELRIDKQEAAHAKQIRSEFDTSIEFNYQTKKPINRKGD